jgi:hypothetical protein
MAKATNVQIDWLADNTRSDTMKTAEREQESEKTEVKGKDGVRFTFCILGTRETFIVLVKVRGERKEESERK